MGDHRVLDRVRRHAASGGGLADLLGRRRLFMTGVVLFTLSSLLSGLAWSETSLIVSRGGAGSRRRAARAGGALVVVTTFREGRERNIALAVWGAAAGSGGAVGALLGGVLTSYLSWSWIFFVNLPVGAAIPAVTPAVSESRPRSPTGTSTSRAPHDHVRPVRAGLRDHAQSEHGRSDAVTLGLLATGAGLIAAFVAIESRSPAPLLPLRIFRLRTLSAANATVPTSAQLRSGSSS